MAKSHLISAVLQALLLSTLASIAFHHLFHKALQEAGETTAWANFTRIAVMMDAQGNQTLALGTVVKTTDLNSTLPYASPANISDEGAEERNLTITNATASTNDTLTYLQEELSSFRKQAEESFYTRDLPRKTAILLLLLLPLQYYWQLWLERTFPGRPRPGPTAADSSAQYAALPSTDEGGTHEDAIIRKLLAEGKIRRASLSWWNTFVKWVLDMMFVSCVVEPLGAAVLVLLEWNKVKELWTGFWWLWTILESCMFTFFSARPLASLASFVVVPAHKRIVFVAAADLLWNTFFGLFIGRLLPWIAESNFAREFNRSAEEAAVNGTGPGMYGQPRGGGARVAEEL